MKRFSCTMLLSALLLPAFCSQAFESARAQTPQPVLSADPTPPPATPPPTPSSVPTPGPGQVDPNYVIGDEDTIAISVWNEPKFSESSIPVRPDGKITLHLLGDIPASGRTPMQLAKEITEDLTKYVTEPVVNVSVLEVKSKRVYFIGEIGHTGQLPITPGMTILQAIATMGGLTPYANQKRIYILRGPEGKQQKIPFDYKKAIKTGNMQGINLIPGDTIVVP